MQNTKVMSTVVHTKGAVKCEPVLKTKKFIDIVCAERLYQQFEDKMVSVGAA